MPRLSIAGKRYDRDDMFTSRLQVRTEPTMVVPVSFDSFYIPCLLYNEPARQIRSAGRIGKSPPAAVP
jgi:hypothetical protein